MKVFKTGGFFSKIMMKLMKFDGINDIDGTSAALIHFAQIIYIY